MLPEPETQNCYVCGEGGHGAQSCPRTSRRSPGSDVRRESGVRQHLRPDLLLAAGGSRERDGGE
eukprot:12079410-Heterocapsa_arctica.AAC.1